MIESPDAGVNPVGSTFNIQNPIPHPSQKEKVLLETRRAKECQRGIAGAAERAKEGGRVPFESSDTRLGESKILVSIVTAIGYLNIYNPP